MDNPKDILLLVNAPTSDPFYGVLLECARKYGWRLTIEERMSAPEDWRGDGAIVYSVDYPAVARGIRSLVRRGIPVVDLAWSKTTRLASRCVFDIGKAGKLAATHFRSLGFERAAFFSMESVFIRSVEKRMFDNAWGERSESWIWKSYDRTSGMVRERKKLAAWLRNLLLAAPKPMAVVTPNSYNAVAVLNACLDIGLDVPGEVSIASMWYEPAFCENQRIPISGVMFDSARRTREAAALLERIVNGDDDAPEEVLIPPSGFAVLGSSDVFATRNPALKEAFRFIKRNLSHPFGAAEIARVVGVSRPSLDRLFAAELGHSAGDEIKRMRLLKAERMLRNTDAKLDEVAKECGFCHASYLVRTFKSAFGVTPRAFRAAASD